MRVSDVLQHRSGVSTICTRGSQVTPKTCRTTGGTKQRGRVVFMNVSTLPNGKGNLRLILSDMLSTAFVCPAGKSGMLRLTVGVLRGGSCPHRAIVGATIISHAGTRVVRLRAARVSRLSRGVRALGKHVDNCLSEMTARRIVVCKDLLVLLLITKLLLIICGSLHSGGQLGERLSRRGGRLRRRQSGLRRRHSRLVRLSRRLRRTARTGLIFFAGVSRSFHAPLALITSPIRRLLTSEALAKSRRQVLLLVRHGMGVLLHLIGRVLSFHGCRGKGVRCAPIPMGVLSSFRK